MTLRTVAARVVAPWPGLAPLLLVAAGLIACGDPAPGGVGSSTETGAPATTGAAETAEGTGAALAPVEPNLSPEWPGFRGGAAGGVADAAIPAVEWNVETGDNVRWSRAVPGYSHSSPIVSGDSVYVVTAISEDPGADGRRSGVRNNAISDFAERQWTIYALRRDDGSVLWERTAHRGTPRVKRHEKGSHANPTPATDGRHVVALFNSEGLFCWSRDGELLWSRDLGRLDPGYWGQPDNNWGHGSSPVLFEDTVIVQSDDFDDSFLAAFRLADGIEAWRVHREELATWATPLIWGEGDDAVLVAQGGNHVRGYDPRTGDELWSFADHAEVKVPSPIAARGLLVLSGGAPAGRPMYALDGSSAAARRGRTGGAPPPLSWTIRSGGPYTPTPLAYGDLLYVARDTGILAVYELASGEMVYRERLGTGFSASPVAADDRLYLSSEDGSVYVVGAGREFSLLAQNEMNEPLFATPALSDDLLVVRAASRVYGIGPPR